MLIEQLVEEAEKWIPENTIEIKGESILVAYCNTGIAPAWIFKATLSLTNRARSIELADCITAMAHILPYKDHDQVIVWNNSPTDPNLVSVYQSSTLMENDTTIITPQLAPALEEYIDPEDVILVSTEAPFFTMVLAALTWPIINEKTALGDLRTSRLKRNIEEGFSQLVGDISERFTDTTKSLREADAGHALITYTPSQLASAVHHLLLDPTSLIVPQWQYRQHLPVRPWTIFYATTVEEGYYKDLWYKLSNTKLLKIVLNVDPITAPIYTLIIQGLAYGKLA